MSFEKKNTLKFLWRGWFRKAGLPLNRVGASSLNSRKLAWTSLKFTNIEDICTSNLRHKIKFPTMDVRVDRAHYESRQLGMSRDDLCTTCTDLSTSYHDLLTSDKSFLRVIYEQGPGNASFLSGAVKRLPKWGGGGGGHFLERKKGHLQMKISKRKYTFF